MELTLCPKCKRRVLPMQNGTCPGCDSSLSGAQTVVVEAPPPTDDPFAGGIADDLYCPQCLKINPADSIRCDCGFDMTRWTDSAVKKAGWSHMWVGVALLGLGLGVTVLAFLTFKSHGFLVIAWGLVAAGIVELWRGFERARRGGRLK